MGQYEFIEEDAPEAGDYRAFFDSKVLRVWHLQGKEATLTIERINLLRSTIKGKETKQPLLHFAKTKLPLALNKTNAATIAQLYGAAPKDWVGKRVTLYATTTTFGSNTVECVRIRPQKPGGKSQQYRKAAPDEAIPFTDPRTGAPNTDGIVPVREPADETPADERDANPDDDGR